MGRTPSWSTEHNRETTRDVGRSARSTPAPEGSPATGDRKRDLLRAGRPWARKRTEVRGTAIAALPPSLSESYSAQESPIERRRAESIPEHHAVSIVTFGRTKVARRVDAGTLSSAPSLICRDSADGQSASGPAASPDGGSGTDGSISRSSVCLGNPYRRSAQPALRARCQ